MNEFFSAIILAFIQGLTEWLPISSSGHLVLFHEILGYEQSLLFDVALHFGTLAAVFVYFGEDITNIIRDILLLNFKSENGKLGLLILVSSIPAVIFGFFFNNFIENTMSDLWSLAIGFGITGLILFITSLDFRKNIKKDIGFLDAFIIGIAQAVAIFPSISRSGATICAGVFRGISLKKSMRFSFLMSIPVIFGAGVLEIGNQTLSLDLLWATLVSFFVGLLTIHLLIKFVSNSKTNLRWFGAYAMILAILIVSYLIVN